MTGSLLRKRWTRLEYDRLIEKGVLQPGDRIELLGGELVVREPRRTPHATATELASDALRAAFGEGWRVRVQLAVALDDQSEPEPDIAVVPGRARDYIAAHPSRPGLIVEAADSSLALDPEHKGSLYARAQVADYWIVNLVDHVLEVHRVATAEPDAPYGWRYGSTVTLRAGDGVTPLAAPRARIAVADLLPSAADGRTSPVPRHGSLRRT